MLLEFKVRNFLSFKDMQVLRMRRKDKDGNESGSDCAFIYGPNSSGKSNLIKAIEFSRNLILGKIVKKDYLPYCNLDGEPYTEKPTYFEYRLELNGVRYSYGFEIDLLKRSETLKIEDPHILRKQLKNCIISEWLYDLSGPRPRPIWEYEANSNLGMSKHVNRNGLATPGIEDIMDWFRNKLIVRTSEPEIEITPVPPDFIKTLSKDLHRFDTGISEVVLEKFTKVDKENKQIIPANIIKKYEKDMTKDCQLITVYGNKRKRHWLIFADRQWGEWIFYQVLFRHSSEYLAHVEEESIGTRKIIQLLALLATQKTPDSKGAIVIDEIECSIHALIMKEFVKEFKSGNYKGSQLIITTHESRLLSEDCSGIDDVWFIKNEFSDEEKKSSLYSLKSFNGTIKKIDSMYLDGRFSAVPVFTSVFFKEGHP